MGSLTELRTPGEKFTRAIADLQVSQPFFAHLAVRLSPTKSEHLLMPTMGVDAKGTLFFNEKFVMEMDQDELMGCVCHETMHVALLHMLRLESRIPVLANVAMDCVVNMMVRKSGLELPKETIAVDINRDIAEPVIEGTPIRIQKVSEKDWETVYEELLSGMRGKGLNPQDFAAAAVGVEGQFDNHFFGGEATDEERRELERKWQSALADAATYAQQQGKLPAGIGRAIDGILKPRVHWKQLLLKYLRPHVAPVDWSYQRPHRKSQAIDVFLPNVVKESIQVEVVVDTSGSIGKQELSEFVSEIVAIAKSMQHVRMWVTFVDAQVAEGARYEVDNGDIPAILAMEPVGGGGTDMEEALRFIKEANAQVPVVIVLTDGFTPFNCKQSDFPFDVLWVITKSGMAGKVPYGTTIKMD
jgi:predicted metal-dependent peptidase